MPDSLSTELQPTPQLVRQLISLIDLTSLNEQDTPATVSALCQKAITANGHVAAVCIYPQFVSEAVTELTDTPVKIATVANFPKGESKLDDVIASITQSIAAGAQEIDVVFPYQFYLAKNVKGAGEFIRACKTACGDVLLKVIMETGAFTQHKTLFAAAGVAVKAGADFLKTSTGKIPTGATLEAATILLSVIKDLQPQLNRTLGFKASGGVRSIAQAASYVTLAQQIMGEDWVKPSTFRLGASQLLETLLTAM